MTANALKGDRDKVLEVGMNDHIAKPINLNQMFKTMAKWITPKNPVPINNSNRMTMDAVKNDETLDELVKLVDIDIEAGLVTKNNSLALYKMLLNYWKVRA